MFNHTRNIGDGVVGLRVKRDFLDIASESGRTFRAEIGRFDSSALVRVFHGSILLRRR